MNTVFETFPTLIAYIWSLAEMDENDNLNILLCVCVGGGVVKALLHSLSPLGGNRNSIQT